MADTQWQKLDGDAELVRSKGRKYQDIADAISRATATLDKIVDDASTTAKSMDATKTLASDVKDDIAKATDRYRETGDALVTYASALDTAISESETAATQIAAIEDDLSSARTTASNAQQEADDLPKDASQGDVDTATSEASSAASRVTGLEGDLALWQGRWNDAKSDKDTAANAAKGKIDEVVTGDKVHGLEDGFWDHVGEAWDAFYKVFKVICDVAGILAIFLSWVPILGQVLIVLAAVGAILAVIDTAIKMGRGEAGWGDLFLAVGGAALALFGGKALGTLAKYAKARMVVRTTEGLTTANASARFGRRAINEAVDTVSASGGSRAWDIVKSPFVRNVDDAARFRAFQSDKSMSGFLEQLGGASKQAFPNPFQDFRLRALTGNQDVIDMVKLARESGIVLDGPTRAVALLAGGGAGMQQIANFAKAGGSFSDATTGSDGWQMASDAHSIGTSSLDAPWNKISSGGIQLGAAIFG
jgi:hypothetical protein